MTSALRLLPGDRVAVAPVPNANWDTIKPRIGKVLKVMSNGASIRFDDAKSRDEEKGIVIASSQIRFAMFDGVRWVGVKQRPIVAREGEETMPEKTDMKKPATKEVPAAGEAAELYARLKAGGSDRVDEFIRLMEGVKSLRERESAEEKLAAAEHEVESCRSNLARADEEVASARAMVDEFESRRAAAFEALRCAEREYNDLNKQVQK